jgi:hypothetical protein
MGGANEAGRFGFVTGGVEKIVRRFRLRRPALARRFASAIRWACAVVLLREGTVGSNVERITKMMVKLPLLM